MWWSSNSSEICFSYVLLELIIYSRYRLLSLVVRCRRTKPDVFFNYWYLDNSLYRASSVSVNLWAELSRFNNKSSIRASKLLLTSPSRNMQNNITYSEIISLFISVIKKPFQCRTTIKDLNMVGIYKSQELVFFQLCGQIILHCVKDILEAKLIDFFWKVTSAYFISVRCIITKKPECFDDSRQLQLPINKKC